MSMLKRSLFVGCILFALVPLNYGACWFKMLENGATHCQDVQDKTWHPVGSNWKNSRCENCKCDRHSLSCCEGLPTPVNYADDCIVEYNYKACTSRVVKKNNRKIQCDHDLVGK